MAEKYTLRELNNFSKEDLITLILSMQGQIGQLTENLEMLMKEIRKAYL